MARSRRQRGRRRGAGAVALLQGGGEGERVNVTPLIDVVMVLIIFYLIVGRLVLERRGGVDLPSASVGEVESADDHPIVVVIDDGGSIKVDGERTSASDVGGMVAAIRAEDPSRAVQIRGDRGVGYGTVRPVMTALREAGVTAVQLAAREDARIGTAGNGGRP